MSIFDKLKFWKKEAPPIPGPVPDLNLGLDRSGLPKSVMDVPEGTIGQEQNFEQRGSSPFSSDVMRGARETAPNAPRGLQPDLGLQNYAVAKDIEIVSSKLDALRASLESINQRLAHLERIAEGDQPERKWRY